MMIGAWLTSRMREQRLKPSMSGRPTSSRISAGSSSSSARSAWRPSAAERTDIPACRNDSRTSRQICGSSSTTRTSGESIWGSTPRKLVGSGASARARGGRANPAPLQFNTPGRRSPGEGRAVRQGPPGASGRASGRVGAGTGSGARSSGAQRAWATGSQGSSRWTVVPSPGTPVDSIQTVPPCASTTPRTRYSPSPLPRMRCRAGSPARRKISLEDPLLLLRRHPEAAIAHADDDALQLRARLDGDLAALRPVLDGVAQHVEERLAHPVRIPARRRHRRRDVDAEAVGGGHRAGLVDGLLQDVLDVHLDQVQRQRGRHRSGRHPPGR